MADTPVRVVVPCGDGDFLIRDLIQRATARYKKAIAKPADSWVTVHNLRQLDGGILDPDDRLLDVADDREQIIANYDEQADPHHGGDGTSGSSDSENASPNIFKNVDHKFSPFTRNDIEITGEILCATPPLHVRRGSEPTLNCISPIPSSSAITPDPTKRWSAAPVIDDISPSSSTPVKVIEAQTSFSNEICPGERGEGSGEEKNPYSASSSGSSHHSSTPFHRFARSSNRCSVQILSDNPSTSKWASAAEKIYLSSLPGSENKRADPVGGAAFSPNAKDTFALHNGSHSELVILNNDGSPLGIHVIPCTDEYGKDQGLLVEGIEHSGKIAQDGRIHVQDQIIDINGHSLYGVSFLMAQKIFKDAMQEPELQLRIIKPEKNNTKDGSHQQNECQFSAKKVPPSFLSSRTQAVMLQSNTRKLGKKLIIKLVKGHHGLGFSITTRDNPACGEVPIYIKNILPKGAAIEEGTLHIGDRLLQVNDVEVTGCSQSEVATLLRRIPIGSTVELVVSRQENEFYKETDSIEKSCSPMLPRKMSLEKSPEDSLVFPWKQREFLTFEIPVHDSERAGLGVSVKGKTSNGPNGSVDLGIFVKNVIHGGAASKDGRLRQNDQLVNINGHSLLGKPNSEAMETLRTAMHQEGPNPGMITLTVARRVDFSREGTRSSSTNSLYSGNKGNTANDYRESITMSHNKGNFMEATAFPPPPHHSDFSTWNPIIQRIVNGNCALRNESYYMATHDTWNTSHLQQMVKAGEGESSVSESENNKAPLSPTINPPMKNTVLIQDEYVSKPNSNCDFLNGPDTYTSQSSLEDTGVGFSRDQVGRQSMSEKRHATLDAKNTDTYQRTKKAREERERQKQLMENVDQSSRNRELLNNSTKLVRSTSEESLSAKHHSLSSHEHDCKDKRKELGPGLGMKRSSSLESLQTMVQDIAFQEGQRSGSCKTPRGRGCNESFRAAVDRSYEAPLGVREQMETLAEEESESGSGFGRNNSRQSSINSTVDEKLKKSNKKKVGLLKGLGSVFRFGKHRKQIEVQSSNIDSTVKNNTYKPEIVSHEELDQAEESKKTLPDSTSEIQGEYDDESRQTRSERMHQLRAEHQRRHAERNCTYPTDVIEEKYDYAFRQTSKKGTTEQPLSSTSSSGSSCAGIRTNSLPRMGVKGKVAAKFTHSCPAPSPAPPPPPKAAPNPFAPLHSTAILDKRRFWRLEPVPSEPKESIHFRSRSYDIYRDSLSCPGSRAAFVDPHRFSHYVNYEQIQQHIRKQEKLANPVYEDSGDRHSRDSQKQKQLLHKLEREFIHESILASREAREYQSQRCSRESSREHRPVSNYYEYESVQAYMGHSQDPLHTLPKRYFHNHEAQRSPKTIQRDNNQSASQARRPHQPPPSLFVSNKGYNRRYPPPYARFHLPRDAYQPPTHSHGTHTVAVPGSQV